MALQSRTITVGADKDVNNGGKNYVSGQVIYIKDEAGVLAPIFRDIDGLDPIAQNTISNVTNAKGQFTFFIEEGNYIAEYNKQSTPLFVFGADYFNNQIDFVTNQILSNTQPYSAGNFADGFTFTELNQYGNATVNDGGTDYATTFWYIGGTLPHTVEPLTNPRDFPLLYQQRDFNSAEFVATKTTENAQDFIDSFALKIFQSPTDGLTEINTRTLLGGEVYQVRKVIDDSLATIYSDKEGLSPVTQNGTSNVSDSDGVVEFYIADGDYYVEAGGSRSDFSTGVSHLSKLLIGNDKFQLSTTSGGTFLELKNTDTDTVIAKIADGSNSSDAHVFNLPFEARRDSHTTISTAGSLGGSTDHVFRTNGFSDYIYLIGDSTFQAENFSILYDTKPSRNDGTKKDGTGGGGLDPSDDVYSFDAAMVIPTNGFSDDIRFPTLGVSFAKHIEFASRSGGNTAYRFIPDDDNVTITESVSGNVLGSFGEDYIALGNKSFHTSSNLNVLASNGSHSINTRSSLSSGESVNIKLAIASVIAMGEYRVLSIGSGGSGFGVSHITFQSDGTTVTTQTAGVSNLHPSVTASLSIVSGVLELDISYSGGIGGSIRLSVSADYDCRAF